MWRNNVSSECEIQYWLTIYEQGKVGSQQFSYSPSGQQEPLKRWEKFKSLRITLIMDLLWVISLCDCEFDKIYDKN